MLLWIGYRPSHTSPTQGSRTHWRCADRAHVWSWEAVVRRSPPPAQSRKSARLATLDRAGVSTRSPADCKHRMSASGESRGRRPTRRGTRKLGEQGRAPSGRRGAQRARVGVKPGHSVDRRERRHGRRRRDARAWRTGGVRRRAGRGPLSFSRGLRGDHAHSVSLSSTSAWPLRLPRP
jgi:hypothetical protein